MLTVHIFSIATRFVTDICSMLARCRTVRLAEGMPEGGVTEVTEQHSTETDTALQSLVSQQRRRQRLLFHDITVSLRRSSADLQRLRQLRETAEVKHPPPSSPELLGLEELLTSEQAWREYEWRCLFTTPSVDLPPPREVDIPLPTTHPSGERPLLAAPGRTCAQGFFPPPSRGRLAHNEPRQRALLPGSRLPNAVILRLLWSTRTLLDVQHYRVMDNQRSRRRQHWEYFEWSESDEEEKGPFESLQRLESVTMRRRNRRKISMTKHENLENWLRIAENGVDESALPDSEDEAIANARRRCRFSRRGRLLSDVDGTTTTGGDACSPTLGRLTQKKRKDKKDSEELRSRSIEKQSGEYDAAAPDFIDNDIFSRSSSEYLVSDEDGKPASEDGKEQDSCREFVVRSAEDGQGDQERAFALQGTDRLIPGTPSQAGYSQWMTLTEDGQLVTSRPSSSATAAVEERSGSVPPESSTPQTVLIQTQTVHALSQSQLSNRLQRRRQTRRTTRSASPSRSTRDRLSMSGGGRKHCLNTHMVRPDMEADIDSASSARSSSRRHALRMAHLFGVKDYICEDSEVFGTGGTEWEMQPSGVRRSSYMQMAMQRMKSVAEAEDVSRMLKYQRFWSSSRIPGVFYDESIKNAREFDEAASKLAEETSKRITLSSALKQKPQTPGSDRGVPDGGHAETRLVAGYMQYLTQYRWARELLRGVGRDTLQPWKAAERLVKQMTKQPFEIQQEILYEVQTIFETFAIPDNLQPISDGIMASLNQAIEDVPTLAVALDTLLVLADQMDVVMANILTLLALGELDVRDSVQSLLTRLGLVDPHHLVLTETLSWAPRGRRRDRGVGWREIIRRALSFIGTWTQAFEAHSTLIAEQVNKETMDATIKYNIIKILKTYEPHAIEETIDGFNVNFNRPPSTNRLKNPKIIEVLNYFVEMTDIEDRLRRESVHFSNQQQQSSDPLQWRRANKDILVPPCPSPALQANRHLSAGVQRPTALVTHWRGEMGLAPGPWPAVAVSVHLRIADKYYRNRPPAEGLSDPQ